MTAREIFHYTSMDGFKRIYESQVLWVKYFRDLNDSSEIFLSQEFVANRVIPICKKVMKQHRGNAALKKAIKEFKGRDNLAKHEADIIVSAMFEVAFGHHERKELFSPHIFSFCDHAADAYPNRHGLLSMWRGYGKDGGVSLVFDRDKLNGCLELESEEFAFNTLMLTNVVYDDDLKAIDSELRPALEKIESYAYKFFTDAAGVDHVAELLPDFLRFVARLKHRSFHEEHEVRIIAIPWDDDEAKSARPDELKNRKIKKRHARKGAHFIDLFDGDKTPRLPIERIIVGPHPDQKLRQDELARLLGRSSKIEITCSETPYIPFGV